MVGNTLCTTGAWTSLYYVSNGFLFLHIPLYFMFSIVVYSWTGSIFLQVLVKHEHTSIRDSSSGISLLIFFSKALSFQNPQAKCIFEYSSQEYITFTVTSYCTLTTG
jgi:hypothetical protein